MTKAAVYHNDRTTLPFLFLIQLFVLFRADKIKTSVLLFFAKCWYAVLKVSPAWQAYEALKVTRSIISLW